MNYRIQRAIDAEEFEVALEAFRAIEEERELRPNEMVTKARCLQLHPRTDPRLLADAKRILEDAIEADPQFVPALIELGWFYLNVQDNAAEARSVFRRAVDVATAHVAEALVRLSRSTEEVESKAGALRLLREWSILSDEVVRDEIERLT